MKTLITSLLLAAACAVGYAQNAPNQLGSPSVPDPVTNSVPILESPIITFLTTGSNWNVAAYAIYDSTTKEGGGGIGAGYLINSNVVAVMRIDIIGKGIWVPSGSIQLQAPITFFGKVTIIPLTFAGMATSIATFSSTQNASIVGIFGVGGALRIDSKHWYIPSDVLADYERWTGGPFNDNQLRAGLNWKL